VVLLDRGLIVAQGTHGGLLASSAAYREVLAAAERHEERGVAGRPGDSPEELVSDVG